LHDHHTPRTTHLAPVSGVDFPRTPDEWKPLNTLREGKPQFQISPRCEMLRKGFLGRYRRVRISGSAERYHDEPEKNEYSHPHDALQYAAVPIFGDVVRGREEQRKQWSRPIEELYADRLRKMRANIV
jgi:hypothetical protein